MEAYTILGHTQRQGGSELQAGGRALLNPSDMTFALSSMKGRMAARTMMALGVNQSLMNYVGFRPHAVMEVIRRVTPTDTQDAVVVDPAGGYSPQFIWLAESMPHVQFIEMDQPKTVDDKLQRLKNIPVPSNVTITAANLGVTPLHEALNGQRVDVVIALAAYAPSARFVELLRYLRKFVLKESGKIVAPFPYKPGVVDLAKNSQVFRKVAGNPVGMVEDIDEIRQIFRKADYPQVEIFKFSDLARDLNKPIPADIEIIAVPN
jgi:hypothetical protein